MDIFRNGITAHRGNSEFYPQNTIAAFESGIAVGADWLELDIHYTADRKLVVIHDSTTKVTADKDLQVGKTTLEDLRKLDFAFQFRKDHPDTPVHRICTLEELFLKLGPDTKVGISIQPKDDIEDGVKSVEESIAIAERTGMIDKIGFNDCHLEFLCRAKEINSSIPIFYDVDFPEDQYTQTALKYGFENIVCYKDNIIKDWAENVKAQEIIPGAWTVNDLDEFQKLRAMGIERFYTDCPVKMLAEI